MVPDWFNPERILSLLINGWHNVSITNFLEIEFPNISLAAWLGGGIVLWFLFKLLLIRLGRSKKNSREYSGHLIYRKNLRGLSALIILSLPKIILIMSIAVILIALTHPFVAVDGEERRYIETRTRIDVRDVSTSMAQSLSATSGQVTPQTRKSKAEIAHDAHLKFLQMREGEGDRVSYWLFSSSPFLVQDFIVDDEVYYLQVFDAPWILSSGQYYANITGIDDDGQPTPLYPRTRHARVPGQSGTMLSRALRAIIEQFDQDEEKQRRSPNYARGKRSVLVITDAEIPPGDARNVSEAIDQLRKRDAVLYMIFVGIDPSSRNTGANTGMLAQKQLLEEIVRQGGRYFSALEPTSLEAAFMEVNSLEKAEVEIERIILKEPVHYKFLFIAIIILLIVIPLGLIFDIFGVYP
jgi:hypothetical protein